MIVTHRKKWQELIMVATRELKLPMIRQHLEEQVAEAMQKNAGYEEFLALLLQQECDAHKESARYNRIRRAEFTHKKYLEGLSVQDLPQDAQKKLKLLKSLAFIQEGRNVILAGNAGTGKTHIAIGLGTQACLEGYKVWFTTVPLLVNQIKECRSTQTLRAFQNRFEKYDLVIADEMGYISFDKEGAELLFTHLYPVMTAAMIDRLTHQAYIVNMNGNSYRMKETKEWLEQQKLV